MESSLISIFFPPILFNASKSHISIATSTVTTLIWLVCWGVFLWSLWNLFIKNKGLYSSLREFASVLEAEAIREVDLDALNSRFNSSDYPLLAEAWKDYEATLLRVPEGNKGIRVYSTASAKCVFNRDGLSFEGSSLQSIIPSLLTGLGILGTFLGLSLGLSNINLASSELAELKAGMTSLLKGAHTAFVTSVWGIFLSLVLTWFQKKKHNEIQRILDKVCEELDRLFARRPAEAWLSEVYMEAREQTLQMKKFNEDIAWSIASALEERLASRLTPALENLLNAIERLTQTGSAEVARVISREAGAEVIKLGEILQQASGLLNETLQASSELQRNVGETVSRQLALTVSQVEESLGNSAVRFGELTGQVGQVVEQVRQSVAEQISGQKQHFEEFLDKIRENTKSYLEDFLAKIERAFGQVSDRSSSVVSEVGNEIRELLEKLGVHLKELGEEYKVRKNDLQSAVGEIKALLAMIDKLVGETAAVLDSYRESAQPVREAGQVLSVAVESLAGAGNTLRQATQDFKGFWDEYRKHSSQIVAEIRQAVQHTETAWRAYEDKFGQVRQGLESVFETLSDGLREYTFMVQQGISEYLQKFDGEMAKAVSSLGVAVGSLEETLQDYLDRVSG